MATSPEYCLFYSDRFVPCMQEMPGGGHCGRLIAWRWNAGAAEQCDEQGERGDQLHVIL
jgi:hypothetical protein